MNSHCSRSEPLTRGLSAMTDRKAHYDSCRQELGSSRTLPHLDHPSRGGDATDCPTIEKSILLFTVHPPISFLISLSIENRSISRYGLYRCIYLFICVSIKIAIYLSIYLLISLCCYVKIRAGSPSINPHVQLSLTFEGDVKRAVALNSCASKFLLMNKKTERERQQICLEEVSRNLITRRRSLIPLFALKSATQSATSG